MMTGPEKQAYAVLEPFLGADLAGDIIAHRRGMKVPLTKRGAETLVREYQKTGNAVAAAELHLNMGWRGFSAEWAKPKGRTFHDTNNPMPAQSANYGRPEPVAVPETISPEEAERRRQMVARLRAQGVIGRTVQ